MLPDARWHSTGKASRTSSSTRQEAADEFEVRLFEGKQQLKIVHLNPESISISPELTRSVRSKQFEDRLKSSIEAGGLAEPLKVAPASGGGYVVVDGVLRLRAIMSIRKTGTRRFETIPAYVVDFCRRFEVRFQTDIYQDLLPSQLASLVEYLHEHEQISKTSIAQFIGISPATLRNYTGLWRLVQRGGLFAGLVDVMDIGLIPASNPYAWLRLTPHGIRTAIEQSFSNGQRAEDWIEAMKVSRDASNPYSIKFVEFTTAHLPSDCYREDEQVRAKKRDLGLRRATGTLRQSKPDSSDAISNLQRVATGSRDRVLRLAAASLQTYIS